LTPSNNPIDNPYAAAHTTYIDTRTNGEPMDRSTTAKVSPEVEARRTAATASFVDRIAAAYEKAGRTDDAAAAKAHAARIREAAR
jgi:hypothetical protein